MAVTENEFELQAADGVPTAAIPAADPFDMFPGVDSDDYPEIVGRAPIPPGTYLFRTTELAWDTNKKSTLLLSMRLIRALQVETGAPVPEGGIITERFNTFWPPEPGPRRTSRRPIES